MIEGVEVDEIETYPRDLIKMAARRWGNRWCHMYAKTEADIPNLHRMADAIGVPRSAFQDARRWQFKHYDLIPPKRAAAIRKGATETTAQERGRRTAEQLHAEGVFDRAV